MTHLLVTNDFPPKVGGIQAYLWELWSRMDPSAFAVLTASSHPGAPAFDAEQRALGIFLRDLAEIGGGQKAASGAGRFIFFNGHLIARSS